MASCCRNPVHLEAETVPAAPTPAPAFCCHCNSYGCARFLKAQRLMGINFPFDAKKNDGSALLIPIAGLVAAGVLGSAELGRRLFRNARLFDPDPDPVSTWNPSDYGFDPDDTEEVTFESDGAELYGWYCRAKKPRASILFCHGKSGNLSWFLPGVKALVDSGLNVFTFDYRGYGRSSGRPSIRGVVRDTVAAAREHERRKPENLPAILWGYSLGGAIGAQAFVECSFDGMVLHSTFTSLPEITRLHYPGTALHLLAGSLYDTLSFVRDLHVPLLVLHGDEDETVPVDMGRSLHESCAGSTFVMIPGGMHGNLFEVARQTICGAMGAFISRVRMKQLLRRTAASRSPAASATPATP